MTKGTGPSRASALLVAIVPFLLAVALGAFTLPSEFVLDDRKMVSENERLDSLANIPALLHDNWWGDYNEQPIYRPLAMMVFAIERAAFGNESAAPYHIVNAMLYGVASALLGVLALRLGVPMAGAFAAGALFAVHPIHTEPVTTVVGLADLSATILVLIALMAQTDRGESWGAAIITSAAFFAGMLFKENTIALPAAVAVLPLFLSPQLPLVKTGVVGMRRRWRTWLMLGIALLGWYLLRCNAVGQIEGTVHWLDNVLMLYDQPGRIAGALSVSPYYHLKFLVPWPLCADYSFAAIKPPNELLSQQAIFGAMTWLILFAGALLLRRIRPIAGFGILLYVFAILPVSNIFFQIGTIFAERLLFLPSAGGCLAIGAVLGPVLNSRGIMRWHGWAALAAACAVGSALFVIRCVDWRNDRALGRSIIEVEPESFRGRAMLGTALYEWALVAEPTKVTALMDEAQMHLEKAVELVREHVDIQLNLAWLYDARGMNEKLDEQVKVLYELAPERDDVFALRTRIASRDGDHARALEICSNGLELHPESRSLRLARARALLAIGRSSEAADEFQVLLIDRPFDVNLITQCADALLAAGRLDEAMVHVESLLNMRPDEPGYKRVQEERPVHLTARGNIRAMKGDLAGAAEDFSEALAARPSFIPARIARAEALIRLGRFDEARADIQTLALTVDERVVVALREMLRQAIESPGESGSSP